ncbi:hypothetical protein [Tsukamurella soli]|uniref:hypothetical protein n=1 Tax=Tsukamurella soli TaxID=644556 RepID=UPI00361E0E83
MVYELLTGDVPFTGDTAISLAYQRLHNDVPLPSRAIAGVPPALDAFVARACSRDPRDRYADGQAMADALADVAEQLHLPAFTVPAPRSSAEQRAAVGLYDAQRNQPHIPGAAEPTGMVAPGPPPRWERRWRAPSPSGRRWPFPVHGTPGPRPCAPRSPRSCRPRPHRAAAGPARTSRSH